jgi:hypothetical protein
MTVNFDMPLAAPTDNEFFTIRSTPPAEKDSSVWGVSQRTTSNGHEALIDGPRGIRAGGKYDGHGTSARWSQFNDECFMRVKQLRWGVVAGHGR